MSNSINSGQDPERRFHDLFRVHYDAGRGKPETQGRLYVGWTDDTFLNAMDKAGSAPSKETLSNWLGRRNIPLPDSKEAFLKVFFPKAATGDPSDIAARDELSAAWTAAWYKRRVEPRKRVEPAAAQPATEWRPVPGPQFEGLVEFDLEDPIPSNEGPGWHLVPAILRFGDAVRPWKNGMVRLSLLKAYLSVLETSFQIAGGRLIGKGGQLPHDNFQRDTGCTEILGPKTDGHLRDWVLEEPHPIAVVRPVNETGAPLTAQVVAWPVEVEVAVDGGPAIPDDDTRQAVLKALVLENRERDGLGRVVLARRQMERKPLP